MQDGLLISVFVLGYLAITLEHSININKAASALVTGTLSWTIYIFFTENKLEVSAQVTEHMGEIAGILFFLLGAMSIVELIDSHDGFDIITNKIKTRNRRKLLFIFGMLTFFLSALLDNLTTTIVMVSLARKILHTERERWFFAGIIIIAANAGGAWSPMGDVTTTMLWIGKQITAANIVERLFIPSLVCVLVPLVATMFMIPNDPSPLKTNETVKNDFISTFEKSLIFFSGMLILLLVPIFKSLTHLPPFIGMLFALGLMWILTEFIHRKKPEKQKGPLSVAGALRRLDASTILFFLGILLCISALQSTGILGRLADYLAANITSQNVTLLTIGILSAIVDNVPLVAGIQGMYPLTVYPTDHYFWEFLAYVTGTGGSILIIGSAAGVAAMGMEKITFFWYLKRIAFLALIGYFAGALVYMLETSIFKI